MVIHDSLGQKSLCKQVQTKAKADGFEMCTLKWIVQMNNLNESAAVESPILLANQASYHVLK